MRVLRQGVIGQPDLVDEIVRSVGTRTPVSDFLDAKGLGEDLVYSHARIHCGVGILKHHLYIAVQEGAFPA